MTIEIEIRTIDNIDYLIIDGRMIKESTDGISFKNIVEELVNSNYITIKVIEE